MGPRQEKLLVFGKSQLEAVRESNRLFFVFMRSKKGRAVKTTRKEASWQQQLPSGEGEQKGNIITICKRTSQLTKEEQKRENDKSIPPSVPPPTRPFACFASFTFFLFPKTDAIQLVYVQSIDLTSAAHLFNLTACKQGRENRLIVCAETRLRQRNNKTATTRP